MGSDDEFMKDLRELKAEQRARDLKKKNKTASVD